MGAVDDPIGVKLAPDFTYAESPDGLRVAFTRLEKCVLEVMCRHPNQLLTRDQILDALSGTGSEKRDRNIDFLINRLRRKLSDDARNPRYISTRYGEGYIWTGPPPGVIANDTSAFLLVGPVKGLDNLAGRRGLAENFAADLRDRFSDELPAQNRVVLVPDCPPASDFTGNAPTLSVELTFFSAPGTVNCVATVREFRPARLLAIHRLALPANQPAKATQLASEAARHLLNNAWRTLATATDTGMPLPLLMRQATTQPDISHGFLTDSDQHLKKLSALNTNHSMAVWQENETRLRGLLEANPDDARLKIMYATQIHSKYIMFGQNLFQAGIDDRNRDEDEIEQLVLGAFSDIQSEPEYAIMAAKLLHFLGRGYSEIASELSEDAYASSISAAGALSIVGQLRAFAGDTAGALHCHDQALNLVEHGTKVHLYALTLKMQALHSVVDFDALRHAKHEFFRIAPASRQYYEPMFADPDNLSVRAKAMIMKLSRDESAGLLLVNNYICSRLFRHSEHRANSLRTPLTLFVRRFGKTRVPEEITAAYPELLDRFA